MADVQTPGRLNSVLEYQPGRHARIVDHPLGTETQIRDPGTYDGLHRAPHDVSASVNHTAD